MPSASAPVWLCLVCFVGGCPSTEGEPPADGGVLIDAARDTSVADAGSEDAGPDDASANHPELSQAELAAARRLGPPMLPAAPVDVSNAFADDPAAARLGQRFFFDPRFSGRLLSADNDGSEHTLGNRGETGKIACSGCHIPEDEFVDTRTLHQEITLASDWVLRRTPTLLDISQAPLLMWDGRRDTLYNQPVGAIESAAEMNSSRLFVAQQIHRHYRDEYTAIFGPLPPLDDVSRFPQLTSETTGCVGETAEQVSECRGMPGDGGPYDSLAVQDREAVTRVMVNFGKAIGAYERLLTCGPGRFDAWVNGDPSALTDSEINGFRLFVGRGECTRCHDGPFFSDFAFHNVGLIPEVVATVFIDAGDTGAVDGIEAALTDELNIRGPYSDGDDGRLPQEVDQSLTGAFRTPSLRCLSNRPSFMHTGHMATLEEVVHFFNRGGDRGGFPGRSELADESGRPIALELSDDEVQDLVAFLHTLQGPGPDPSLLTPLP